jgi:hypothetical protein
MHSPEFYRLYRAALDEAKRQGVDVLLYDDWSFPTGTVGGLFYTKYPQYCAKSLEMVEKDAVGPARVELPVPEGIYVGAVMMKPGHLRARRYQRPEERQGRGGVPGSQEQLEGHGILPGPVRHPEAGMAQSGLRRLPG